MSPEGEGGKEGEKGRSEFVNLILYLRSIKIMLFSQFFFFLGGGFEEKIFGGGGILPTK